MIKSYIFYHEKDWDVGLPFLLFASRDSIQESLGFTPFELVFGHKVRGPLGLLKDKCFNEKSLEDMFTYAAKMKERLRCRVKVAQGNLRNSQIKMKACYDQKQKVIDRRFNVGDLVLAFLPVPGSPLQNSFIGRCIPSLTR